MKYKGWTPSSIECYKLGCMCDKCSLYAILGKRCQMKKTVFELIKTFGKPNS